MKNLKQFTRFLLVFCTVSLPFLSFSQPSTTGYEIVFKTQTVKDKYLYLTGIYGNKAYIADSAKYANKQYVFKNNKKELPSGFYCIESQKGTLLTDFIVDNSRKFTIDATGDKIVFVNSDENIVYQNFKKDLEAGNDIRPYYYTTPESLLAKYVKAQYIPVPVPEFHWGSPEGRDAAAQQYYQFLIAHYFDNIDFKDIRLMYTPLDVELKDFFMESLYPQTPENVISSIENLFERILNEKPSRTQIDVKDFYLKKLIHLYMNADPKFDTVFVYLVDNYVSKISQSVFISDSEINVFQRIADRMRKTLVGQTIPVFESYTNDHHKISTAEIPAKYTILWFWDPDCEHCIEYTPILCDFYTKYHNLYNFEVIACSVTEDYDRWITFIKNHHLEWFNTSYAIEEPNYDAVEYFNFADTPAIFVIDKQHKIVARQFPVDDLFEIFESLEN
ncbi:MAG: redoxin domain-containing protein [Bacteroidetes bacterium]|nr:redoxin domain-containing protein [Bacteroidota bacterium]MCL1969063.1 redoxin domain-containing protein [Bacteroidota bacterium]